MNLEQFLYNARFIVIRLAHLMLEATQSEDIKKEPNLQHKIASTAQALLIEAETLEKELQALSNLDSDNSISE